MTAKTLMVQGTTSDAGKSLAVTAICRLLRRRGYSVAPFKPQNMALNSAVTAQGGEIGRAQALQALACDLEPHIDFNPVLLKPSADQKSQVILNGKAVSQLDAAQFGSIKELAFDSVLAAFNRLKNQYEFVIVEGAGSPAEINLRKNDIANMGFAEAVDCPVVLISDIDRGGVFAHIVGTLALLSQSEQARVKGFIINKFRGSLELLQDGLDWMTDHTRKPLFGVLPFLHNLKLDAEDAIRINQNTEGSINIKVPVFSRISNHTDFDPLTAHPQVKLTFVGPGDDLTGADLIILPGSKNVRAEMKQMTDCGWDKQIKHHLRYGGKLLGICGGFQLLGESIHDALGIEDDPGEIKALGLLNFKTELKADKQLKNIHGRLLLNNCECEITGYEIHCGVSEGVALNNPFAKIHDGDRDYFDGAISDDGQIAGTYIHGLFEKAESLAAILKWVTDESILADDWQKTRLAEIERLTDCFEEHLNVDQLIKVMR